MCARHMPPGQGCMAAATMACFVRHTAFCRLHLKRVAGAFIRQKKRRLLEGEGENEEAGGGAEGLLSRGSPPEIGLPIAAGDLWPSNVVKLHIQRILPYLSAKELEGDRP